MTNKPNAISPRERVKTALRHETPDRAPVDFLATLEIWEKLVEKIQPDAAVGSETTVGKPDRR